MAKGQIRVQTENIFPIIKKFLYSDHEIFLRELISNAVDASQKIKTLASKGEVNGELGELRIDIKLNKDDKTISIADKGIGMTQEEVDKYLNQVAFSSAEEFVEKYKDASIIGHFGLGFYSAFMVSNRVDVITKSYQENKPATFWTCDGNPEFEIKETDKTDRGTEIILHVSEDCEEFLEEARIKSILNKFCRFLPIPIFFKDEQINNTEPLWIKKPSELTDEDYKKFYNELYPFSEPPLFWIHLNVDYPFNLTGILYFPKIKQSYEIQKDKIQLYCNQVFVTDEVKDIVPEFLMLLHGVIDSPDIPLNVSRSYLQGDPNVRKINTYITKKVADKLEEIFKTDRKAFAEKCENIGLFVKYGMMTDDKFLEKASKFFIMEDALEQEKNYTLEEYKTATEAQQKNKEGKHVILYTTDIVQQDAYIQACKAKGYVVVKLETIVDAAFINHMEVKWNDVTFTRVDADIVDNIIDKSESNESVLSEAEVEKLKTLFKQESANIMANIEVKGLSPDAPPVIATRPEMMRRMKDMGATGGPMTAFYANMPDEINITINGNHAIYQKILKETDEALQKRQVDNLADLALLSQGLLKGNALTNFINRSMSMM